MQYSQLIARIQADIYNNGAELITGDILQGDLLAIISALASAGAGYGGIITPDSSAPASLDQATFYIAIHPGTYSSFGVTVTEPSIVSYGGGSTLTFTVSPLGLADAIIVNNLTTDDATKGLSAAQGVVLDDKIYQMTKKDVPFPLDATIIWLNTERGHQGGATAGTAGTMTSDFVDISGWTEIVYCLEQKAETIANVAFYDENKSYISGFNGVRVANGKQTMLVADMPEGTRYVRFCTAYNDSYKSSLYASVNYIGDLRRSIDKNTEYIREVETTVAGLVEEDIEFVYDGYFIDISTGNNRRSSGWKATDYFKISEKQEFELKLQSSGAAANVAYYDENKTFISGVSGYSINTVRTITNEDFPEGTAFVRFSTHNADSYAHSHKYDSLREEFSELLDIQRMVDEADYPPFDVFLAACGDSITNANHTSIDNIPLADDYMPIDGYPAVNYRRKNYAYYIARANRLKWANYGYGGTTMTHTDPKGYSNQNFFPFVDDRITSLKEGVDWDYIMLQFGFNDCNFNPVYQRDLWLTETYGEDIGYPTKSNQIGAEGFASQAQKNACDAATGTVGDVEYTNNEQYFFAKFIGTPADETKNTWWGAFNYALPYLMRTYTKSKILVIVPFYGENDWKSRKIREATIAICEKWGVSYFDFEDLPYWYRKATHNNTPFLNPDRTDGRWVAPNGEYCPATVEGYNQSRFSYDTLHPSNLGYKTLAHPISDKLLNE